MRCEAAEYEVHHCVCTMYHVCRYAARACLLPKSNDMMVKPWIAARLRGSVVLFLSLCLHLPPSCTYTRNTHTVTG